MDSITSEAEYPASVATIPVIPQDVVDEILYHVVPDPDFRLTLRSCSLCPNCGSHRPIDISFIPSSSPEGICSSGSRSFRCRSRVHHITSGTYASRSEGSIVLLRVFWAHPLVYERKDDDRDGEGYPSAFVGNSPSHEISTVRNLFICQRRGSHRVANQGHADATAELEPPGVIGVLWSNRQEQFAGNWISPERKILRTTTTSQDAS
jgi:hypothetical protein